MVREDLRLELASALHEAAAGAAEVTRPGVRVRTKGAFVHVDLSVARIREPESVPGLLLVTVCPQTVPSEATPLAALCVAHLHPSSSTSMVNWYGKKIRQNHWNQSPGAGEISVPAATST